VIILLNPLIKLLLVQVVQSDPFKIKEKYLSYFDSGTYKQ
jgi:hypothetical protein